MKYTPLKFLALVFILFSNAQANVDKTRRLGLGFSNQLVNGIPALSFKFQSSPSFAYGAVAALDTDSTDGGHGVGMKLYRNIFAEPNLNFYSSILIAMVSKKTASVEESGFQGDLTVGSEFHFQRIESIGFSFEFGLTFDQLDDFSINTAGHNLLKAGVHFYL